MPESAKRGNNLNLIRLLAAGQVMLVHGLNPWVLTVLS